MSLRLMIIVLSVGTALVVVAACGGSTPPAASPDSAAMPDAAAPMADAAMGDAAP